MNRRMSFATAGVALGLVLTLAGAACSPKIQAGSRPALLLDQLNSLSTNVHVGQEFTYAVVLLQSQSDSPVTIKKVVFTHPEGIGDVIEPVDVKVALLDRPDPWPVRMWSSFPPTGKVDGRCRVQQLEPAQGVTIPPHRRARLVVLFKALKPGDFYLGGQDVRYTVDGEPGSITLPNHFLGKVAEQEQGDQLQPDPIETACKKLGNLLPG